MCGLVPLCVHAQPTCAATPCAAHMRSHSPHLPRVSIPCAPPLPFAQPPLTLSPLPRLAPCTHPPPYPASCTQALLQGHCTQLTLAYCAPNPYSFEGMQGVLEQIAETLPGLNVKTEVS